MMEKKTSSSDKKPINALQSAKLPTSGKTAQCDVHGDYAEKILGKRIFGCPQCRAEKHKAVEKAEITGKAIERLEALWLASGAPKRYRSKRLEGFLIDAVSEDDRKKQQCVYEIARQYVDDWQTTRQQGKCLVFLGRVGTGKTHLAVSIARAILERYSCRVQYVSLIDVIERIKDSWNGRSTESANDIIRTLTDAELLIIDEASARHGTPNEQLQFFRIINKRYENVLPTILISNTDAKETERLLGNAAWDRLREGRGQALIFDWPSHRARPNKHRTLSPNKARQTEPPLKSAE